MTPTLKLGPRNSPRFEVMPSSICPIIALLVEQYTPLNADDRDSILSFLQLDTIYLEKCTEGFFFKLEFICKRIVSNELVHYDVERLQISEFSEYLKCGTYEGKVTQEVRAAAQQFVDFLASHSDYWPLR